jgi:hypothetical protein
MNIRPTGNLAIRTGLALAMTLAVWSPALAQSAEPAKKMTLAGKKMDHAQMMMDRCQGMMAEMKIQDAELTAQVARMNSASKESKVDLMAEIITKMVQQRTAMDAQMTQMQMEMMKQMQMGMGSKPHHPMMKGMDKKMK